ncbi:MAG: putative AcnD-accessory protein PrpF [Patiriisocius sp.]|mgnify:CR=1 FL=1|jgi:probable AcnD-accessory protein PrpF
MTELLKSDMSANMKNNALTFYSPQIKIPATYMRGGTSKGVFFSLNDLPQKAQEAGKARDELLLRVIGSPDPYAKHTDGMGGATSSTSKVVIVSECDKEDHHVNYLFGQVAIDKPFIDWSGNCGNLSAAVGSFAIESGLIKAGLLPVNGIFEVRIWQQNIQKTIVAYVPIQNGQVQENGEFELDGVTFPASQIKLDFIAPSSGGVLSTGNLIDTLHVPNIGDFTVSYINAGIPTMFLDAKELGYTGQELQNDINNDESVLAKFETIRAYGAIEMGLIAHIDEAHTMQHTPKIAFVAAAASFITSSGKQVDVKQIDLNVRALSMGKLHHAMMGTAAVAIGTAAAIEGTLVNIAAGGGQLKQVTFGHPSGTLTVGGDAKPTADNWEVTKVSMSRSARILMEGQVRVPAIT